jgi:hypothetical protein
MYNAHTNPIVKQSKFLPYCMIYSLSKHNSLLFTLSNTSTHQHPLRTFGKILGGDSERILEMPRTFSYQANVH